MQVNLSTNLLQPAGETSVKSAEISADDADNGFSAQMGQILNQGEKSNDVRQEEGPSTANSSSDGRHSPKTRNDGVLLSPHTHQMKKASARNFPGSMSGLFKVSYGGGADAPETQSSPRIAGKSGARAPSIAVESNPAQIQEGAKKEAKLVSSTQFPVDSTAAVDNPQSVITLAPSAQPEGILQSQNAVSNESATVNQGKTIGAAYTRFPAGAFKNANIAGMYSEMPISIPVRSMSDSNQDPDRVGLKSDNAGNKTALSTTQPDTVQSAQLNFVFLTPGNSQVSQEIPGQTQRIYGMRARGPADDAMALENAESGNSVSPSTFLKGLQKPVPENLQDGSRSLSGQVTAGSEAALSTTPPDTVQSAQSNLDVLTSGNSEVSREMPGQPQGIYGMRARGPADDAMALENAESGNSVSPSTFLKGLQKAVPEKQQDGARSFTDQVNDDDEAALSTTQPDTVPSAQSNLDVLTSGNSEVSREMPGQPQGIYGMRERGRADDAMALENAEPENSVSPSTFLKGLQKVAPEKQQDGARSSSDQVNDDNEAAPSTTQPDTVPSAQSNLDVLTSGNSEASLEIPHQSQGLYGMRERSLADDALAPEDPDSENDISSAIPLKSSSNAVQASIKSADTGSASAAQNQAGYPAGSWLSAQAKPDLRQLDPVQPESSAADRLSPAQSVFAPSLAQSGESAPAAGSPPAQSSTSQAPEIIPQLAEQISMQVRDGKGEIRIQLMPDSLGHLEISAENTNNGLSARISTESNAVKSYLENNLQVLQQTLQDLGLKIDRIHIIVQDALSSQSSSDFSAQYGHTGSGQDGRAPKSSLGKPGSSPTNPLDEVVLDATSWLALNPNNRFHTVA